jgi:hypothetical protein
VQREKLAAKRAKSKGTTSGESEEIQRQHAERVQELRAKAAEKRAKSEGTTSCRSSQKKS